MNEQPKLTWILKHVIMRTCLAQENRMQIWFKFLLVRLQELILRNLKKLLMG